MIKKYLKYSNLITIVIAFNFVYDFIGAYYTTRGGRLAAFRGLLLFSIFVLPYLKKIRFIQPFNSIFIFMIYVGIILPFSSNILYSIHFSIKVFIILIMMPIGYFYINTIEKFYYLNRTIIFSLFMVYLTILYANLFDLGSSGYVGGRTDFLRFGGLSDNFNVITYLLIISPLGYLTLKRGKERYIYLGLIIINIAILLISMKRIAIAGLLMGIIVFAYFFRSKGRLVKAGLIIVGVLLITSPLYFKWVAIQFSARQEQGSFERNTLESEIRYKETMVVWDEVLSMEDPIKSFIGLEAFYSIGLYGQGAFNRRQIHVDYNLLVYTCGLIGLFLYLNIYLQSFLSISKILKRSNAKKDLFNNVLKSVFFSLFFTSLFTSFAGQMEGITFRSIVFLYMGSIMGFLKNESNMLISKNNHLK